ncbi:Rrf2 family transcriptional regulator [Streptococcus massiliensis]|uniref:Putative transcriptional regulator n=1 Tax=Streptococcus massiliensis TaxID=313439 RepID=A0A380L1D0_9STRE|nr:Rrf2 family transcriptional regulator [Streptococcus massiliensis]SUN77380.1 putative transcriptional regulator [Streptococcus massiliensis]
MQISSRFTIATHIMIVIALEAKDNRVTSDFLAGSVGVNPVIIRKTLSQLKKAGLISVARGTGGAAIEKELEDISLLDIYRAVGSLGKTGKLFSFHENPNPNCPIGRNVHAVLDDKLLQIQNAMERELAQSSLADVVAEAQMQIQEEGVGQNSFLKRNSSLSHPRDAY